MSKFWLPRSARQGKRSHFCELCRSYITWDHVSQLQRHIRKCERRHEEYAEEHLATQQQSGLTSISDKEQWRWGRQREAAEGKKGFKGGVAT